MSEETGKGVIKWVVGITLAFAIALIINWFI